MRLPKLSEQLVADKGRIEPDDDPYKRGVSSEYPVGVMTGLRRLQLSMAIP